MGKKRHTQDKLWITRKEMVEDWGGKKEEESRSSPLKKLPFYCCSLSFTPFNDPVCLIDGTIFDIINILPYIKKFKKNPITGFPLKITDLIKLNFFKNQENEYHCPVTYKVFTEHSVIIAIRETGNVYSFEAFEELNKKAKNYKDLLSNKEFEPKNIIYIQDPKNSNERLIQEFFFVKNNENIDFIKYGDEKFFENSENFVNLSSTYKKMIEQYDELNSKENSRKVEILKMINNKPKIEDENTLKIKREVDGFEENIKKIFSNLEDNEDNLMKKLQNLTNFKKMFRISPLAYVYLQKQISPQEHSRFSDGKTSTAFTSTSFNPNNNNKLRSLTDDEIRINYFNTIKSKQIKGYVRINTNFGSINLLLHCDLAPKTCENFIELCESGYYNNTIFHRLVKNFILQGGDPTGSGKGGSSIYGKSFEDEFHPKLLHKHRGTLSMANSGKNTNGSQFFIAFQPADYLDNKHTVFGEVVGGLKLLDEIEKVGADEKERPKKEVKILTKQKTLPILIVMS